MNLNKKGFKILPIFSAIFLLLFFVNPTNAASPTISKPTGAHRTLHTYGVNPVVSLLDPSSNPNLVGGVPFCSSGGLGTILCYPPDFLKKAYNFPSGLDGTGSTIVIVDAFGSATAQSDLNKFDSTFGLPATTVTILCGPTWTGAATDKCPLNTIGDIKTVGATPGGVACGGEAGVTGWGEETALDLAMSHGIAPGASIVLVVGDDCFDSSLNDAEMAVVSQAKYKGSIMSQSFGSPDDLVTCSALDPTGSFCVSFDPTLLDQPNAIFSLAKQNHWTVIASSGDAGANTNAVFLGSLELTPSFPASSPLVLAAGGTQGSPYGGQFGGPPGPGGKFKCVAGATCNTGLVVINGGANGCGTAARPGIPTSCFPTGYGGEAAWNEALTFGPATATGGGISMNYAVPSYQQNVPQQFTTLLGNSVQATGRMNPDVSFNSAIYGGFPVWLGFGYAGNPILPSPRWGVFGGTSAASPAWAGIIALANQANGKPLGFVNPSIYEIATGKGNNHDNINNALNAFHDIILGNNAVCSGLCGEDGFLSGPGYDLTTGWGTPDVAVLVSALTGH